MKGTDVLYINAIHARWQINWRIFSTLGQRHSLEQLTQRACRKRLTHQHRHYLFLLSEIELKLNKENIRHPQQYRRMLVLHGIWALLRPHHSYYRKGAASKYRRNNLTGDRQESYSYS